MKHPDGLYYYRLATHNISSKEPIPKHAGKEILPTDTEFASAWAEYEANEYQRQRAAAYPAWQDQLDKIYHEGIDAWKAEIQAIKDQYPKPDGA